MSGFYRNGKKEFLVKGEGLEEWKGSFFEANYVKDKKQGPGTVRLLNPKLNIDLERTGDFEADVLRNGTVREHKGSWRNINITYKERMGKGTYFDENDKILF